MRPFGERRIVLGIVAALLALPAGATAAPTVTEYSAGISPGAGPIGVTAGPDGAVWFTENGSDDVGRIAADGSVTEFHGLTRQGPRGITTGPDGNLWVTETSSGSGAIARLTPSGVVTEYDAGLSFGAPQDITAGPDGNLWFTENGGSGAIGRITPSGTITEFTAGLTPNSSPWSITAGPDGNLWFTEKFNSGRIGRITPAGVITEFGGLPAGLPQEIAAGPDGNLWFTAAAAPGYIGRITPAGEVEAFTAGLTANANPQGITAAPDGALYFTEKSSDVIGRITTAGAITEYAGLMTADAAPFGIATGADGNLWFAENALDRMGRMTPPAAGPAGDIAPARGPLASAPLTARAPAATPVLGDTIVMARSTGTIRVRRPGEHAFSAVSGTLVAPVGSEIDARRGTVVLTSSLGAGRTQRASFRGARFKVRQSAGGGGMTDIVLTEPAARRRAGARAAARRRPPHPLWAHDSHGRYRTFGHNSVATVRGTTWRTTERADGTLTQVVAGAVSVRDLRRHRSILVRAGHRYLARAKLRG